MVFPAMHAVYVEWGLVTISAPLVFLRCYFQYTRRGKLFWADGFVILAWWFFAFQTAADWTMRHFYTPEEKLVHTGGETTLGALRMGHTWEQTIIIAKMKYSENVTYYSLFYMVKFAWLCFFDTLIPKTLPILRKVYWVTMVLCIIGWIYTTLVMIFYCWPISRRWALDERYCSQPDWTYISIAVIHFITDVILYVLPILVLRTVNSMARTSKLAIMAIFALGFICVAWALVLLVANLTFVPGAIYCIIAAFEQYWAILVVCLPPLKALFAPKISNLRSQLTNRSGRHGQPISTDPENGPVTNSSWKKGTGISVDKNVYVRNDSMSSNKDLMKEETTDCVALRDL